MQNKNTGPNSTLDKHNEDQAKIENLEYAVKR
jgi:hypothetical protein